MLRCSALAAMLLSLILAAPSLRAGTRTTMTASRFDATTEAQLLRNGYLANIVSLPDGRQVLRASQRAYQTTTWARDLDYAISGYSYLLDDMTIFGNNIQVFLERTGPDGVVPETINITEGWSENRQAWDAMPNLISAAYTYAAKTGDRAFIQRNIATLEAIAAWIERLDSDGDGLPDRDIFPYGYFDTVENSVMHTYAIAKFYGAYRRMAELERWIGRDGRRYEELAARLRAGFHRGEAQGGYWRAGQAWPIAWKKADGRIVNLLETFGVLQATREGLIAPEDGWRYRDLFAALHESLAQQIDPLTPTRLTLGGYPRAVKRVVTPTPPDWMLDAAAPWIVALDVPERARAGYAEDAARILEAYRAMSQRTGGMVVEFAASANARYGTGDSGDRGRLWDTAAWFEALYAGHYGLRLTLDALVIAPQPLARIGGDGITGLRYQDATVDLELDAAARAYTVRADRPIVVELHPVADGAGVAVNGVEQGPVARLTLNPGQPVQVQSLGVRRLRSDPATVQVWRRADLPVQQGSAQRSWLWGPAPWRTTVEPYQESPGGERLVEYYDKARMEISRPEGNRADRWFVTNGLLVKELVSGQLQVGDARFEPRAPAEIPIAGDPADNPAPSYRAFGAVASLNNDRRAPERSGQEVIATLDANGTPGADSTLARPETRIARYEATLGHNLPAVFWRFMQAQPDDWLFAFGYPISEPYWVRARVGGVETWVLTQLFERRVLTYTPANPRDYQVEMGNVGQHYYRWRYGAAPWEQADR
ncbi:hypothetical protein [Kallotenue papyrolyticum]|uniref:alpha-L-rhamnosidase-related protein n=1 Tax=Kallotenue papyrolyticum TaxID=1325125 RepID=UPI001269527F|nr:hypothetical protein [Kallotenue papyrolyticum]